MKGRALPARGLGPGSVMLADALFTELPPPIPNYSPALKLASALRYGVPGETGTAVDEKTDLRSLNNPHRTVQEAGAEAARKGEPLHSCPYSHPAMRNSWLRGYARAQQMTLGF